MQANPSLARAADREQHQPGPRRPHQYPGLAGGGPHHACRPLREFNNAGAATARFLTSQPNGTTRIVDGLGNGSLGGLMPTTGTTRPIA